jgi:murein DD-endopeptidase MepM/ murein hydrolase activator NlpD
MFGNPVAQAVIRPPGSPLIVGDFRVTATFGQIDDAHPTPHIGVDIGNGKCGEPILAMEDGPVSFAGLIVTSLGSAKVVRVKHPQFSDATWESGYAHLNTIEVKVGQLLTRGQRLGTLGMTGSTACHLHIGMKRNGVEVDSWPLLDQNGVDMLKGTLPRRINNRKGLVLSDNTRFRAGPTLADEILAEFPKDTEIIPTYSVVGETVNGQSRWYAAIALAGQDRKLGYFNLSTIGPLVAIEVTGHSDQELADAAKKGAHLAADSVSQAAVAEATKYPGG